MQESGILGLKVSEELDDLPSDSVKDDSCAMKYTQVQQYHSVIGTDKGRGSIAKISPLIERPF